MWVPTTAAELEGRVGAGELSEHAGLEAKQEIAGNTFKVARAVAAMATAGGIIVYGVAEDEHGRLARLAPIDLHGAAERVDSIGRRMARRGFARRIPAVGSRAATRRCRSRRSGPSGCRGTRAPSS
jgi:hypothetical protein